jgi:hypothetical protein
LIFALSLVLVASTVPGMGRSSPDEAQAAKLRIEPTIRIGKQVFKSERYIFVLPNPHRSCQQV